ncbi:hypothetical protein FNF27_00883 [Cafeteria roenbergensis]|nr:hypothetical protein FNF27_00883 [Cafeteria roenbergensis]
MLSLLVTPAVASGIDTAAMLGAQAASAAQIVCAESSVLLRAGALTRVTLDKTGTITEPSLDVAGFVLPPAGGRMAGTWRVRSVAEEEASADDRAEGQRYGSTDGPVVFDDPALPRELATACKGAPETIIQLCGWSDERAAAAATRACEQLQAGGFRVVALAFARVSEETASRAVTELDDRVARDTLESGLHFAGAVSFANLPKHGSTEAWQSMAAAGLELCVVTGDSALTAGQVVRTVSGAARGLRSGAAWGGPRGGLGAEDAGEPRTVVVERRAAAGEGAPRSLSVREVRFVGRELRGRGEAAPAAGSPVECGAAEAARALLRAASDPAAVPACTGAAFLELAALAATGDAADRALARQALASLRVVGRASPDDKGRALSLLRGLTEGGGGRILHCGDSANDVQAFSAANVSVSIAAGDLQEVASGGAPSAEAAAGGGAAAAESVAALLAASSASVSTARGSLGALTETLRRGMAARSAARFATEYAVVTAVGNAGRMLAAYAAGHAAVPLWLEVVPQLVDALAVLAAASSAVFAVARSLPGPGRRLQAGSTPLARPPSPLRVVALCALQLTVTLAVAMSPLRPEPGRLLADPWESGMTVAAVFMGAVTFALLVPGPPVQRGLASRPLDAIVVACVLAAAATLQFGLPDSQLA